jgi:3-oxoacyl-[acyl-carrier protein] reductase
MDLQLTGRAALITGGSEGIGKATAIELAREGAHVAICARRADVLAAAAEEIRREARGEVLDIVADVTRPEDIDRFVGDAHARLGRIDILVNNAGTAAGGPFEGIPDEAWGMDLDLKLMGAVRTSQAVVPHMKQQGSGRIVNVAHVGGKAPGPNSLPSSVSRAAGIALTKAMSKDLAQHNILVNAVCVGIIKSGQISRAAGARFPDLPLDQAYEKMGAPIPLGRIGEAREVATLITYLASPLGGYITGTAINVDGGMGATV